MPNGFAIPSHFVEFVTTGHSKPTLPTTGTLATVAGTETLTNKTLTNPTITGPTPVQVTSATVTLAPATHSNRTTVLDRAAGIAVTLPASAGTGDRYKLHVKATFTGAATVKVANATDVMQGTATLYQDGGDTVVGFATAASSDTITLYTASNTTGGIFGAIIELEDVATGFWSVRYISDAGGTPESTPFSATVS